MTNLSDIHSLHWQPRLNGDGIVTDLDDIHQAILIILRTRQGADRLRPEFGSNLHLYLDYPIDRAAAHVVRESVQAIRRWEPRVTVVLVEVRQAAQAHLAVKVVWQINAGTLAETEVSL